MKSIKILKLLVPSILVVSLLQGCIPILIGTAVYAESKSKDAYTSYANEARKDNTQREIHGLKPNPIMTFNEWRKGAVEPPAQSTKK